ncbi:MAG: hypothetical protein KDA55_05495, partial [Planctomycetales bacterium]|nr:hypothetical protein [Planctomycetales bacterium]
MVEELLDAFAANAKLRIAFDAYSTTPRVQDDTDSSGIDTSTLMEEFFASDSWVTRRLVAVLMATSSDGAPTAEQCRRAFHWAEQHYDDMLLAELCLAIQNRVVGQDVVGVVKQLAMETKSSGGFSAAISALAAQGRAGLTSLLDLDDLVGRKELKDDNGEKQNRLQDGIGKAVSAVLWELAA